MIVTQFSKEHFQAMPPISSVLQMSSLFQAYHVIFGIVCRSLEFDIPLVLSQIMTKILKALITSLNSLGTFLKGQL